MAVQLVWRSVKWHVMHSNLSVRIANEADAEGLLEIYRPYVQNTAVSFEIQVPEIAEYEKRIVTVNDDWLWLVATRDDIVIGYAYGSAHRPREAYKYSVETSAYVHSMYQRQGVARLLYNELLVGLAERGYQNAYAGVALPNEASVLFHKSMGFESIGVFPKVGFKFDKWHDVAWLYKPLATP